MVPLQGFFNFLIFVSHKIYNYRRVHGDVTRCSVMKLLFQGDAEEPILFSNMSIVEYNQDNVVMNIVPGDEDGSGLIRVENQFIIPGSQSGGDVLYDGESQRDDDLSGFHSLVVSKANDEKSLHLNDN